MKTTFDAIVVGAGPAGSSAALTMARAGLDVALVERGTFPGEKNMFGGILHRMTSIEELLPDFWDECAAGAAHRQEGDHLHDAVRPASTSSTKPSISTAPPTTAIPSSAPVSTAGWPKRPSRPAPP